jgi:hypothetical protein
MLVFRCRSFRRGPGNTVPVRVTRHMLYFNVPKYPEMKMKIVHLDEGTTGKLRRSI